MSEAEARCDERRVRRAPTADVTRNEPEFRQRAGSAFMNRTYERAVT